MAKRSDQIKQQLRRSTGVVPRWDFGLSSGSTLLNLACTADPDVAFWPGTYTLFVGDSDSGKTFIGLTCFAEAAINPAFKDYRLIYDAPEGGALMDFERFFGKAAADRIEPPSVVDGVPHNSRTAQEFYRHLDDLFKAGKPFVMVLDSQDCLSSDEEIKKFEKSKAPKKKDQEQAGSYGDSKAKVHSANLRRVLGPIQDTGSILIIINQTRDSFDMFNPSTYSGGRALKFYATLQLWSKQAGKINRNVRGKERELGINAKIQVKKNRVTGRDRTVQVPIFHSLGISEVDSLVDYLVSEKVWKMDDGIVSVIGLGPEFDMRKEKLVQKIEAEDQVGDVRDLVVETWNEIEKSCEVERRSRYGKV